MCFGGGGGGGADTRQYPPGTFANPGKPSDPLAAPQKVGDPTAGTRSLGLLDNQKAFGKQTLGE